MGWSWRQRKRTFACHAGLGAGLATPIMPAVPPVLRVGADPIGMAAGGRGAIP
jgi:hypothetical protein